MTLMSQIGRGFFRISNKLSKIGGSMDHPHCPGEINIDGKIITDLVPLGGYHRLGITKAGRVSFSGSFEDKRVKVFGAYSADQVNLRVALESTDLGQKFFPRIIASDKTHIVEEWINGLPLANMDSSSLRRTADEISSFLSQCQSSKELLQIAVHHGGAFCYFQDYLIKRLEPWRVLDFVEEFILSWQDAYERIKDNIEVRLSHPDLSEANILLEERTERLVVIDNELLGVGRGWILDRRNSFLKNSQENTGANPDKFAKKEFMDKSWRLRLIGSALDAGDFQRAYEIVNKPDFLEFGTETSKEA